MTSALCRLSPHCFRFTERRAFFSPAPRCAAKLSRRHCGPARAALLALLFVLLSCTAAQAESEAQGLPSASSASVHGATGGISPHELAMLGFATVGNLAMVSLRSDLDRQLGRVTVPANTFGDWDINLSQRVYAGEGSLHGGFSEYLGTGVMPAIFIAFYASQAVATWASGRSLTDRLTHQVSPAGQSARLFWGALETVSYSLFIQQVFHSIFRRDRPSVVLHAENTANLNFGGHMSFYSGHASLAFAIAGYSSLHLGDALYARLRSLPPVPRALIAWGVPSLALYGVATYVAYGRFHDMQHFFSDTIIGSVIGTGIGNFFYLWHTRAKHAQRNLGRMVPQGSGIAYLYTF